MARYIVTSATRRCYVWADSGSEAVSIAEGRGAKGPLKARKCPEYVKTAKVYNDGGFKSSGIGFDTNDCTVRALAICLGIEYKSAHRLLEVYGRQRGKGFRFNAWASCKCVQHILTRLVQYDTKFNHAWYHGDKSKPRKIRTTIGQFVKANPKGTFIIGIDNHVFALVDGVINDTWTPGPKKRIDAVWVAAI